MPSGVNEIPVNTPSGILIWAGSNVSTSGSFAASAATAGGWFTYAGAQSVCPTGWRLPTSAEVGYLVSDSYTNGRGYSGSNWNVTARSPGAGTLTFPAAGYRNESYTLDQTTFGYYWSQSQASSANGYLLYFTPSITGGALYSLTKGYYMNVRCVR